MPVEYYQLAICVAADAVAANKAISRDPFGSFGSFGLVFFSRTMRVEMEFSLGNWKRTLSVKRQGQPFPQCFLLSFGVEIG